ncbi:MAG: hypothetical protein A2X36_14540 [Elusimicrobia bacterium GWA2_69_24]|nr:MAG: hypothetical protein A2X36_14540 [Elusimicrobia bacterium GWA2_69_24]
MSPLIALLTDFGSRDPYVGVMKGVLLGRAPGARIVDLCHEVPPQDVRMGALHLLAAAPFFPAGTLFVCVVDPGVGTARAVLWASDGRRQYLAPDNGLLSWTLRGAAGLELRRVTNRSLFLPEVSRTFQGRDVFAPVAAALAGGLSPEELGPRCVSCKRLPFPAVRRRGGAVRGEVIAVDGFGNAVTNIRAADLGPGKAFSARGVQFGALRESYASARPGRPLALTGSLGFVEFALRDGNLAESHDIRIGEVVHAR